jgi:drug/metabolite transporter (DMT)-like permease
MAPWLLFSEFKGELAALTAACFWAVASVLYSRVGANIPPILLNLIKGLVAIALLLLTILLGGQILPAVGPQTVGLLLVSGIVGIGLGDTAFFKTLQNLGPRRTLLMETLAPPLTAIFAWIFLGEIISPSAWCGIFLVVLGVAWVITERAQGGGGDRGDYLRGISWALVAEFSQATGAILSRQALSTTSISPLWSTLLRLVGGTLILLLWVGVVRPKWQISWEGGRSRRTLITIFMAIVIGTYFGIWLQQTAFKFTAVGIAQALSATSPLWVLPFAVWSGDKLSCRSVLGVVLALMGISLLFAIDL